MVSISTDGQEAIIGTIQIGSLNISVSLDSSSVLGGVVKMERALSDFARSVGEQFSKLNSHINQLSTKMTVGITAPFAIASRSWINAASDVEELGSAFAFTFGAMADNVESWAEVTGDAIGRSTHELQQGALAFQQMFKVAAPTGEAAAEMSKQFALLAQDLSSFYNTSPEVALMKLRSALQGESEPIRDFGVFLTEAAVAEEAVRIGAAKTTKEVSEQAKIMARASIIMRDTVTAQGDAARTSGSYANQLRALSAQWSELSVKLGQILLPIATKIVGVLTRMVDWFADLPPWIHKTIIAIAAFAAALGPLLFVIKGLAIFLTARWIASSFGILGTVVSYLIAPIQTLVTTLGGLFIQFGGIGAVLRLVVGGLLRLAGPIGLAIAGFMMFKDYVLPVLQQLWETIVETFGPRVTALFEQFQAIFAKMQNGPIGEAINKIINLLNILMEVAGVLTAAMVKHFGETLIVAIDIALTAIESIVDTVSKIVDLVSALLSGDWAKAWEAAGAVVESVADGWVNTLAAALPDIRDKVKAIWSEAKTWLVDRWGEIGTSFKAGLEDMRKWALENFGGIISAFKSVYDGAKKWLVDAFGPIVESVKWASNAIAEAWEDFKRRLGFGSDKKATPMWSKLAERLNPNAWWNPSQDEKKTSAAVAKDEKKKKTSGAKGKTPEEIEADHQEELRQLRIEELRARLDLTTNAQERAELQREILREEYEARLAEIQNNKDFTKAQKDAQIAALEKLYGGNRMVGDEQTITGGGLYSQAISKEMAEKRRRLEEDGIARQREALEAEAALVDGRQARLEIERRILDLSEKEERSKLEAQIAAGEIADAAQARADLERQQAAGRKGLERQYQGPLASYLDSIPNTIGEISDQMESLAVNQLKRIEDGFAGIAQSVLGLNGALGETVSMILRIIAQQAILAASGQGGGGFGGFLSGVGSALGAAFGVGGGGSFGGAGATGGWAKGGSGILGGFPGIDKNMLSMNGIPLKRVSRGEMLSVTPANDMGGRSGIIINADFRGAEAGAVTGIKAQLDTLKQDLPRLIMSTYANGKQRRIIG